jgi:hypothetical protein
MDKETIFFQKKKKKKKEYFFYIKTAKPIFEKISSHQCFLVMSPIAT